MRGSSSPTPAERRRYRLARLRLTAVMAGLVAACGALVVAGTYAWVRDGSRPARAVHLTVRPGTFVDPTTPIAVIEHTDTVPDDVATEVRAAVLIGQQRTFDQDPRYGFIVLGEVARRALSPAVNDPGTAIQVASLATAILVDELTSDRAPAARTADDVTVPDLDLGELVIDAFEAIGRDGAGDLAVSLRLQKLLGTLARNVPGPIADTAVAVAERAVQRSQHAMDLDHDRQVLQQTHTSLFSGAATGSPGSGRTPAS